MGLKHNLDWYEEQLAAHFEIGNKTRMGTEAGDAKEVRILNRILRLTEHGLLYEADPRHAELLARSLNLSNANSRVTPGNKPRLVEEPDDHDPADDLPPHDDQQSHPQPIHHIRPRPQIKETIIGGCARKIRQLLQFNDEPQIKTLQTPYSMIYGHHPSTVLFTGRVGDNRFIVDKSSCDRYTGKHRNTMKRRRLDLIKENHVDPVVREKRLRDVLTEGPKWETSSTQTLEKFMAAISKKRPFKKKRVGARAVREQESLDAIGDQLSEDQCTMFRALAARANYLGLDRPDCAYTCKELCRAFSRPTTKSVEDLKHIVRYLVGAPRLVY